MELYQSIEDIDDKVPPSIDETEVPDNFKGSEMVQINRERPMPPLPFQKVDDAALVLLGEAPSDSPIALALVRELRAIEREREVRQLELEARQRSDAALEKARNRLDAEVMAEREDARWRREADDREAWSRAQRSRKLEEMILSDVMKREEALRLREFQFMTHWEREMVCKRALRFEKGLMATERNIRFIALHMKQGLRSRFRHNMFEFSTLVLVLLIIWLLVQLLQFLEHTDESNVPSIGM